MSACVYIVAPPVWTESYAIVATAFIFPSKNQELNITNLVTKLTVAGFNIS